LLNLAKPVPKKVFVPLEFISNYKSDTDLIEIFVPPNSAVQGKQIVDLNFPEDTRIVLIIRNDKNIIPSGGTTLEGGDLLLLLANEKNNESIKGIFN
jgi:Trk K+ transport system NAD-binding subunit